jgi:hypothetical protein
MSELLAKLEAGHVVAIVAIFCGFLTASIAIIFGIWQHVRTSESETALKHDMVQRGLAADEIQKILSASSSKPDLSRDPGRAVGEVGGVPMNAAEMVAHIGTSLIAHGLTGDGLAMVMPAIQSAPNNTKEAIANALSNLEDENVSDEQVLALVRSMCPPPVQPVF